MPEELTVVTVSCRVHLYYNDMRPHSDKLPKPSKWGRHLAKDLYTDICATSPPTVSKDHMPLQLSHGYGTTATPTAMVQERL